MILLTLLTIYDVYHTYRHLLSKSDQFILPSNVPCLKPKDIQADVPTCCNAEFAEFFPGQNWESYEGYELTCQGLFFYRYIPKVMDNTAIVCWCNNHSGETGSLVTIYDMCVVKERTVLPRHTFPSLLLSLVPIYRYLSCKSTADEWCHRSQKRT
jgi:hypothetical protein